MRNSIDFKLCDTPRTRKVQACACVDMKGAPSMNRDCADESFFIQHRKVRLSISPSDHMYVLLRNKVSIGVKKAEIIS